MVGKEKQNHGKTFNSVRKNFQFRPELMFCTKIKFYDDGMDYRNNSPRYFFF